MKIAVVDDSEFERKVIVDQLKAGGYDKVFEAKDGAEGLEVVKAEEPDVVLLDLTMPGMSGLEVLKEIRER